MKDRARSIHGLSQPARGQGHRFVYVGLVAVAFALMLVGKADPARMENVRASIADTVTPILDVLSRPFATIDQMISNFQELSHLRDENARLRDNNDRLEQWQVAARKLQAENVQLKGLLNFAPGAEPGFVTARVIADTGGAFVHSILVSAGMRDGVSKGQAVVTGKGLVGRVQGVGTRSVRVLLITDLNSRIPVVVESTRTRAVLAGNNSDRPRIIHLPQGATVSPGDRIVTSGHGGAFPPGIPVGVVSVVEDGTVLVQPFVKRDHMEYVRVVDYGLKGIIDATSAAEGAGVTDP